MPRSHFELGGIEIFIGGTDQLGELEVVIVVAIMLHRCRTCHGLVPLWVQSFCDTFSSRNVPADHEVVEEHFVLCLFSAFVLVHAEEQWRAFLC